VWSENETALVSRSNEERKNQWLKVSVPAVSPISRKFLPAFFHERRGSLNYIILYYVIRLVLFLSHRDEIDNDNLGSRPLSELLHHLQPSYWFSAHLHVKFSAVVPHDPGTSKRPPPVDNVKSIPHVTKFLALDKILPRREFLQVIEFPDVEKWTEEPKFYYDPEWLAILKSTNHLISVKPNTCYMPGPSGGGQSR